MERGSIAYGPVAAGSVPVFPVSPSTATVSAGGALTLTSTYHLVAGAGGSDDSVASFVVAADMIGKMIVLERTGGDAITFEAAAIQSAMDITLNHDDDNLTVRVTAANTVKVLTYFSAGG